MSSAVLLLLFYDTPPHSQIQSPTEGMKTHRRLLLNKVSSFGNLRCYRRGRCFLEKNGAQLNAAAGKGRLGTPLKECAREKEQPVEKMTRGP